MRSMMSWEVSEEAKANGFPLTTAAASSAPTSSRMGLSPLAAPPMMGLLGKTSLEVEGVKALEISKADTLQERERNSMGSFGVSGGLNSSASGRHCSPTATPLFILFFFFLIYGLCGCEFERFLGIFQVGSVENGGLFCVGVGMEVGVWGFIVD